MNIFLDLDITELIDRNILVPGTAFKSYDEARNTWLSVLVSNNAREGKQTTNTHPFSADNTIWSRSSLRQTGGGEVEEVTLVESAFNNAEFDTERRKVYTIACGLIRSVMDSIDIKIPEFNASEFTRRMAQKFVEDIYPCEKL